LGRTIVVGAGSAGAVISARAVQAGLELVLIEAGPDHVGTPDLLDGTRNSMVAHDWGLRHRPRPRALPFPFPRGKVVGGSSAVNTCVALRPPPSDYDDWGEPDWRFERCLPAFVRLERDLDFGGPFHGAEGPIPIRRHPAAELVPWQAAFLEAAARLGVPACPDANAPGSEGAGPHPMNKLEGRRVSAADGYLDPAVRAGLTLMSECLVRRVLFAGRRAIGVEVERAGRIEQVLGDRVILCAGAIASPGILLRSGVGPKAELARLGVTPVAHVEAVGRTLLDHPGTAMFFWPKRGLADRHDPLLQTVLRLERGGMQIQPGSAFVLPRANLRLVSIMTHVGRPRGAGTLRFPSADPHARPIIESRLFEDEGDLDDAVRALSLARELTETPEMRRIARPLLPRGELRAWIRRACDSGYHPAGTVPMGAAADSRGRVHGTERLHVADASFIPKMIAVNIHLTVLMIGERFGAWLAANEL